MRSLYFGGGTPSVLSQKDLDLIFEKINQYFNLSELKEVTLEANPDDLSRSYLKMLSNSPINRLSIGIQCFDDQTLKWMNRSHNCDQAISAVEFALEMGFNDITADLIYGVPKRGIKSFEKDLLRFANWEIPHFSAYALTIEPKTILAHRIKKGLEPLPIEGETAKQFEFLMDWAESHQYEHYEISNFAKPGRRAIHNSSYWNGIPYLGLGPSAHSFDGKCRYWNISNNSNYLKLIQSNQPFFEMETLSDRDRYNEYILTGLRTIDGISRERVMQEFPGAIGEFDRAVKYFETQTLIHRKNRNAITLTRKGKLLADHVSSGFMIAED